jgi:hypothetical protein
MSKQIRLRRGTTAQHASFTGADGEVTFDTDKKCLVVHDGAAPGGRGLTGFVVLVPANPENVQHLVGCLSLEGGSGDDPVLSIADGGNRYVEMMCRSYLADVTADKLELSWAQASIVGGVATVDLLAGNVVQVSPTSNITVTAVLPRGFKHALVRFVGDTSSRTLTWPGPWKWIGGTAPASLAASKVALLELFIFDDNDGAVMARWSVQA